MFIPTESMEFPSSHQILQSHGCLESGPQGTTSNQCHGPGYRLKPLIFEGRLDMKYCSKTKQYQFSVKACALKIAKNKNKNDNFFDKMDKRRTHRIKRIRNRIHSPKWRHDHLQASAVDAEHLHVPRQTIERHRYPVVKNEGRPGELSNEGWSGWRSWANGFNFFLCSENGFQTSEHPEI